MRPARGVRGGEQKARVPGLALHLPVADRELERARRIAEDLERIARLLAQVQLFAAAASRGEAIVHARLERGVLASERALREQRAQEQRIAALASAREVGGLAGAPRVEQEVRERRAQRRVARELAQRFAVDRLRVGGAPEPLRGLGAFGREPGALAG